MAIEFTCPHWMATKMDLVPTIGWQPKWIWSSSLDGNKSLYDHHQIQSLLLDGDRKRGNMTSPPSMAIKNFKLPHSNAIENF
jgi:hypothetical protein